MSTTNRKILNITVADSVATYLTRQGKIVCGNGKYRLRFMFDSEWADYPNRIARFLWAGRYTDIEFTGNEVDVPTVRGAEELKVGVYTDEGPYTSTAAVIPCEKSILCEPSGSSNFNDYRYLNEARELVREMTSVDVVKRFLGLTLTRGETLLAFEDKSEGLFKVTGTANKTLSFDGVAGIIHIPASYAGKPMFAVGANSFEQNQTVKEVIIYKGVSQIGDYAFNGCRALHTIHMPNTLLNIGRMAFNNCRALTFLTLPADLQVIGEKAFQNCSIKNEVVIPATCLEIGPAAFSETQGGYSSVPSIRFEGKPWKINATAFVGTACPIYVPWAEGEVAGAPWGALSGNIHYQHDHNTTFNELNTRISDLEG